MKISKKLKNILIIFSLLVYLCTAFITMKCTDEPSSLGLDFLPETASVKIFDSYIDTMNITSINIKKYVNNFASPGIGTTNLIVGKSGDFSSMTLLKFTHINANYDSAVVLSASLKLRYRNYYFPPSSQDSLAQISFDIFTVEKNINYSSITLDSITTTTFGTNSQGNYLGAPTADSQLINISLNTDLIRDWLEYAADTGYNVKNYGIVLKPNIASAVLKGFYSPRAGENVRPELYFIVNKNNKIDTVSHKISESVFLADGSIPKYAGVFHLIAGISYMQVMKFDVSKIPSDATINDVQLILTLDSASSKFTSQTSKMIIANYINDSIGYKTEGLEFIGEPSASNSNQYVFRFVRRFYPSPFQRWLQGETNYGLLFKPGNYNMNLDYFVFYNIDAADTNKKPRVIIKYTPRITP